MGKKIRFTKMHGAGNDYIYVNTLIYNIENPAELSVELSRPHFSIGSDGLILIGKADRPDADFSMRIFNNDGSEAMMCGNGTRCVAKYLHDKGLTDKNPIRLQTLSGVKVLTLHLNGAGLVETVTVDMGEAMLKDADDEAVRKYVDEQYKGQTGVGMTLTAGDRSFLGTFVSMGNPHFVIFLDDEDVETFPLEHYGRLLEHHEVFPQRCNIEFANVLPDGTIRMRVWERGSGITLACGTGACATAVAASLVGVRGRQSDVLMDGGKLHIEWNALTNHVMMTGPAAISFEGEVEVE
ncbi:MAG: diaminopimelate epimerase [Bacteroidaceae bacterium]|nr:diaminopimelate epimerase [Bacteroidaceae bacterium]